MRESVRKTLDNPLLDSHLKSWFAIFLIDIEIKADKKRYIQPNHITKLTTRTCFAWYKNTDIKLMLWD